MTQCINALKAWTNLDRFTIIYDSNIDEYTDDGLFNKVEGVRNIAVIGFSIDGDVFGGFFSVAARERNKKFFDRNMFIYSFQSRGRCETPKRFNVREEDRDDKGGQFYKDDYKGRFVDIGGSGGCFYLGNEKSTTWCSFLSYGFFRTENKVLTGNSYPDNFVCVRIVVVRLE